MVTQVYINFNCALAVALFGMQLRGFIFMDTLKKSDPYELPK